MKMSNHHKGHNTNSYSYNYKDVKIGYTESKFTELQKSKSEYSYLTEEDFGNILDKFYKKDIFVEEFGFPWEEEKPLYEKNAKGEYKQII